MRSLRCEKPSVSEEAFRSSFWTRRCLKWTDSLWPNPSRTNPDWGAATVMMLSSAGLRGDAVRCREIGVAAYLTKPVRQAGVAGRHRHRFGERGPQRTFPSSLVTRHSLRENRPQVRILLVEDNAVNQLVALRILEKQGHAVTIAADGKKALAALRKGFLRSRPDGHPDAGDERMGGHQSHPGV